MNKLFVTASLAVLFAASSAAMVASVALAQDTTATSGSNSGAVSGSASNAVNGGQTIGDTTSQSNANAVTSSGAFSASQGGAGGGGGSASSDASAVTGPSTSSATTGPSTATANPTASNAGNAQNITFNTVNPDSVKTVPQVYAPALTTTLTETCMGSTSGGVSALGFGASLGTSWRDDECVRRLTARELSQTIGDREAARAVLCTNAMVRDVYDRIGRPCPQSPAYKPELAQAYLPQPPVIASAPVAPPAAPPPVPEPSPTIPPDTSGQSLSAPPVEGPARVPRF